MSNTLTADHVNYEIDGTIPGSGSWGLTPEPSKRPGWIFAQNVFQSAGLAVLLAVSPLSCAADPWFVERRRRTPASVGPVFETVGHRRITLHEALQLAGEIMRRAEEGRLRAAEEEGKRFFGLEEPL